MNSFEIAHFRSRNHLPSLSGALRVERVHVTSDCAPHDHDFAEIAMIALGTSKHFSLRGEETLRAGDVIVLRPGAWHSYQNCENLVVWNCLFSADVLSRELATLGRDAALQYLFWAGPLGEGRGGLLKLQLPPRAQRECEKLLRAMQKSLTQNELGARAETFGYLLLYLAQLARNLSEEERAVAPASEIPILVQRGAQLLENDLSHAWTLGELASKLHVNRHHLARLFSQHTGLAPMAYLARCRAERAAGLLLQTHEPVGEIALRVGWIDPNLFARRFKAHFGLSPTQYRNRFAREAS